MKKSAFLIAMLVASLMAAAEFAVSPLLAQRSILGRDFWFISNVILRVRGDSEPVADEWSCIARGDLHFPLEKAAPGIQALSKKAAFSDVAAMYEIRPASGVISNPDGSHDILLPNLPRDHAAHKRPFFINLDLPGSPVRNSGVSSFKPDSPSYKKATPENIARYRRYFFGLWKSNQERLAEWKKAHPDFVSIYGCGEWWNNATAWLFNGHFNNALNVEKCLTDEEAEQIRREYFIPAPGQPFTQELLVARALKFLDKQAEVLFGNLSDSYVFDGVSCVGHLAAYHGTGMAAHETSRIWQLWQS